ncbi:RnfH family protein [Undibacterium sp.]|uniref:RnfH family protein n=1 Tax=Undibacterium sp. TaxID=1914977 RepID=UPI00374CEAC1
MGDIGFIKVQVCYSTASDVALLDVRVAVDARLSEAVAASGILLLHPEIDMGISKFGVYGKLKLADAPLHDGDRVEIYRPLIADPKDSRRRRAQKQKEGQA